MESEAVRSLLLRRLKRPKGTDAKAADRRKLWKANPKNGCWEWLGSLSKGYGIFYDHITKKSKGSHRAVYEIAKGKIPKKLHIDHLCRNTKCVNPDHLEAVTCQENVLRGIGVTAMNARKEKCNSGHILNKANTKISAKGWRLCIECMRFWERKRTLRLWLQRRADGKPIKRRII